ncbi:MAG: hypothetical protein E6G34_09895 [Actinobacteria bacterium]|nr:MAG: hypothetical protein E6G34_09895 [Actinomycetota bacterium]
MTRENVEIVWRAIAASSARPPDFEAVNALYHPEHVLTSDWGVEGRSYRGAEGLAEAISPTSTRPGRSGARRLSRYSTQASAAWSC